MVAAAGTTAAAFEFIDDLGLARRLHHMARTRESTLTTNEPSTEQLSTNQLSRTGLAHLHDAMAAHVESGRLPGLVTLVACGDDVHIDTIGTPAFIDDAPLARDAIFRIASLTKPITAVATLSLVEEGLLRLEEPIDELVPELAARRVLRAIDAELDDTVPANRPITLEDLLSYRFGFGLRDGATRQLPGPAGRGRVGAPEHRRSAVAPRGPRRRRVDRRARVNAAHVPAG